MYYIDEETKNESQNIDMIEEYFEQFYFARKKFMVNFLTRNEGNRWNGRFKELYQRNKVQGVLNLLGEKEDKEKMSEKQKGQIL